MTGAFCLRLLIGAALLAVAGNVASAEEKTINAYATWEGRGQIYPTGVDHATFVGAFNGVMFVEDESDLINAGNIICPGILQLNLDDGSQIGRGQCTISNAEGARVFAEWNCAGTHLVGCDGKFKLTAGTGEFSGITGEGDFILRSGVQLIAASMTGSIVQRAAAGIAIWRDFRYVMPE